MFNVLNVSRDGYWFLNKCEKLCLVSFFVVIRCGGFCRCCYGLVCVWNVKLMVWDILELFLFILGFF